MRNIFHASRSEALDALYDAGKAIFSRLWDGIKGVWDGIKGWVDEKATWLKDKLTFWDNGSKKVSNTTSSGFSHASGLAYVPYDNYPANLHRTETVLNATDAEEWRAYKAGNAGGDAAAQQQAPIKIVVQAVLDKKVIGEAVTTYQSNRRRAMGT